MKKVYLIYDIKRAGYIVDKYLKIFLNIPGAFIR